MRILLTSSIFPPQIGGPATYVPQLAKSLTESAHQVCIVTLGDQGRVSINGNTKIITLNKDSNLIMRTLRVTLAILREARCSDAIFSNGLYFETALSLVALVKKKRSVVKIVGDPIWERARNKGRTRLGLQEYALEKHGLATSLIRRIYNFSWAQFNFRVAPSEELCKFVDVLLGKTDCIYIANGIDVSLDLMEHPRDIDIICVSRLVNWKNVDIAIRAASQLNLSALIVGDGPERIKLESLAKELQARTTFIGQVSQSQVEVHLQQSKYFLLLSDYEGLSFALLEAMGRGVIPVVTKNEGNLAVVTPQINGKLVECSVSSVVTAIRELESNPELAKSMSSRAVEHVKINFNGETQRQRVISLLVSP
jgi:glycosyltransferase involved in cell wall biosynthesis